MFLKSDAVGDLDHYRQIYPTPLDGPSARCGDDETV
jgi:hypothetical protein